MIAIRIKTIVVALGTLFLTLVLVNTLQAQSANGPQLAINTPVYRTAIGVRAGETSGLTIKHFTSSTTALEGIVGLWNHGLSATVLYEKHAQAFNISGMNWYYGAGGHAALSTGYYWEHRYGRRYNHYHDGELGIGIDGIIGLEYKIPEIPFAVSLDAKPFVEVVTNGAVWMSLDPSLGIKVTF